MVGCFIFFSRRPSQKTSWPPKWPKETSCALGYQAGHTVEHLCTRIVSNEDCKFIRIQDPCQDHLKSIPVVNGHVCYYSFGRSMSPFVTCAYPKACDTMTRFMKCSHRSFLSRRYRVFVVFSSCFFRFVGSLKVIESHLQ